MKPLAICLTLAALLPNGCQNVPVPPPSDVPSAPKLSEAKAEQQSKASAAVGAAQSANAQNPDGPAKIATAGELSVAAANLPTATPEDRAEATERANKALAGKLDEARKEWDAAKAASSALTAQITTLEGQVKAEREAAASELQRQLANARSEERANAKREQRRIISWVFYGGAFILTVGAALVLGTASYVPLFGPKLAISLGIGAAASAAIGVALNELLASPWVLRGLLGILVAAVAGGVCFAIANHNDVANPQPKSS